MTAVLDDVRHVRGLPGSGRSHWCARIAAHARERGDAVVELTGVEAERVLALGLVADAALASAVVIDLTGAEAALRAATALSRAWSKQATTIVVDDWQWADESSCAVLHRVDRLTGEAVRLYTAGDPDVAHDPWRHHAARLEPLDEDAATRLAGDLAAVPIRPGSLRRLLSLAQGSPRAITELVAALEDGVLPEFPELPGRLTQALARLEPTARRLVLLAGLATDRSLTRLASAADLTAAEARAALAEPARLLPISIGSTVELCSPLLPETVLRAVPSDELAQARRDLLPSASPAESLVHRAHLTLDEGGPEEALATELLAAAETDIRRGHLDAAVTTAEMATRLTTHEPTRVAAVLALASAALGLGQATRARDLVRHLEPPTPRLRAQAALVNFLLAVELHAEDAEAAFDHAVLATGEHPDLAVQSAVWGAYLAGVSYEYPTMQDRVHQGVRAAQDGPWRAVAAAVGQIAALYNGTDPDLVVLRECVASMPRDQALHPVLDPAFALSTCLWASGDLAGAQEHAQARARSALRAGDVSWGTHQIAIAYLSARTRGSIGASEALMDAVARRAHDFGHDTADAISLALGYARALDRDQTVVAAALEPGVVELAMSARTSQITVLGLFSEAIVDGWLATGRASEALLLVTEHAEQLTARSITEPSLYGALVAAAEAALCCERIGRAETWLAVVFAEPNLGRRPQVAGPAHRVAATCAAARGDDATARADFQSALDIARSAGFLTHEARALHARAGWSRRGRRLLEAAEDLGAAAALFEQAGLLAWRRRALDELARLGLRDRDGATLSPSQLRVAELAAGGFSNAEIAAHLNLSGRTVESHLAAAYRKLGIRRRTQLNAALDAVR